MGARLIIVSNRVSVPDSPRTPLAGGMAVAVKAALKNRNAYGLLSEDIHPDTGELWGNLPQTYSMAGIINTATRLSSSWEEAWARD